MDNPAGQVVDKGRRRKGTVATLVSDDPETSAEKTLHDSVEAPEDESQRSRGDIFGSYKVVEEVEGGSEADDVANNVAVAGKGGALKAVLGDGIANVLDGKIRRSEGVAVGVEKTLVVVLLVGDVERREG